MYLVAFALLAIFGNAQAQITAEANVAPDLRECYTDPELMNRNNLPPATIQVLIDIIQKLEDKDNVDLRVLAVLLLHTYRQDGIEYHPPLMGTGQSSLVLPFAPTFHSFYRHKLLLTKLIPSNRQSLDNNTISSPLKCALHHMLSTTVDARLRGDENTCGQLSQYRALRTARSAPSQENINDDVEIFSPRETKSRHAQMRQYNPNSDVDITSNSGSLFERQLLGDSTCPILTGVVNTKWGAISAGTLIAGIAAGAQIQQISLNELSRGLINDVSNNQQTVTNLYPATIAGDLAEAVLIQGTRGSTSISVGSTGNWNSSHPTKYYMLSNRNNVEMTDPEIRGGIDGFTLGIRMNNIQQTYSTLKLSQLLDMYYTPRNGVFDPTLRACNRRELGQAVLNDNNLVGQSEAFAAALNANMPLQGTITDGLNQLVTGAVSNFQSYTESNLNDLNCASSELGIDYRSITNLYIVLDSSWQYETIYPAISYLLESIEVNKFGSSVTLLSASDGSVVVNKTFSLAEFHSNYTLATHRSITQGVNLETVYRNVKEMMHATLLEESRRDYVGGNATVLLFLLNSGNIQIPKNVIDEANLINVTVPDLRVIYATSSNQFDNLYPLVRDMYRDIHTISLTSAGTNVETVLTPVLNNIREVGRRIINPVCGISYEDDTLNIKSFHDYIEPGYINFYSVSPNYFFENNDDRKVTISRSSGSGSLTICHSRAVPQPRRNATIVGLDENLITCQDLTSSGTVEISLQNACDGYGSIGSCPLFYISVQSIAGSVASATCTSNTECRFPYNMVYQIQFEQPGCFSSGTSVGASLIFIISTLLLSVYRSL
ncbi:uncharacterized protein LOC131840635 [Achroia grisella]|uniref:uncharacterized protein LOC131840635 n=1 Tax=Achroia grisella TaxID=688607 RepID=UPI0027D2DF1D|nr:uncharacterized protein LOC131840635 [Achroia grisella]